MIAQLSQDKCVKLNERIYMESGGKMAEIKYWREENRTYLKDVIPLDTPYNIGIEVSSLCNTRCVYCAHSQRDHGVYEGNMTMELFKRIVEEIHRFPRKIRLIETYSFG